MTSKPDGKRILKVLIYIEKHIGDAICIAKLAKVACHSPFHFHRLFHSQVGETTAKYIRRLRMEKAAVKLRYSDRPITAIALDCNYDTPSAFTRAFKQIIGKSPKNYRTFYKEGNQMAEKIKKLKNEPAMKPDQIVEIEDLPLLFIRKVGKYSECAPLAWEALNAFVEQLHLNRASLRYFGISHDDPRITSEEKLRYDACISAKGLTKLGIEEKGEIGSQTLKGGKYALFTHYGSYNRLEETMRHISFRWMAENKAHLDDGRPFFLEFLHKEFIKIDESKLVTKIYIPLL